MDPQEYDKDGFVAIELIPMLRSAQEMMQEIQLGPINEMQLQNIRRQALEIGSAFSDSMPNDEDARLIAQRTIDYAYIVSNKPTIAWEPDDFYAGLMLAIVDFNYVTADVARVMVIARNLLDVLNKRNLVKPLLSSEDVLDWMQGAVTGVLAEDEADFNFDPVEFEAGASQLINQLMAELEDVEDYDAEIAAEIPAEMSEVVDAYFEDNSNPIASKDVVQQIMTDFGVLMYETATQEPELWRPDAAKAVLLGEFLHAPWLNKESSSKVVPVLRDVMKDVSLEFEDGQVANMLSQIENEFLNAVK